MKTQKTVYFTIDDFVLDYTLLKKHFDLSKIDLQLLSTQDWVKQSRLALTQTFPLSHWIYHLFSVKNTKTLANQSTNAVDNAIGKTFQLLDSIRENIPPRQKGEQLPKDMAYYLGEIRQSWVERVVDVLESIEKALDKSYPTNYAHLIDCVKQQIAFLNYASVRVQANEFSVRYTLSFHPFSSQYWFDKTVMSDFKQVTFMDKWIEQKALKTYFNVMVSKAANLPKNGYQSLPNIVVKTDKNAQKWKENLLIKKVVQFSQQYHDKTLVIVPNQMVLVGIKDEGIATIDDVTQVHLLSKHRFVVTTWKTAYAMRHQLGEAQKMCLVKLPFEHPDSMQQQASKYFLPQRVTYFSSVDLVTVLLDILVILAQLPQTISFEIWDNRFVQSAYASKIADIFAGIVKIVEE